MVNDSIHIANPEDSLSNFTINELGSNVSIVNTEVYFINIYLKDNDKLSISGEKLGIITTQNFLKLY